MIEYIEESLSNRANCSFCEKKIGKGTPRGVAISYDGKYPKNYYYCYKCTPTRIKETIDFLKGITAELKKSIKKQKKEIILMELDDDKGENKNV